ncbi:MAG: ParB N-terminal domain-containing protein [Candidatus Micrarchaeota archaeon]|nr:ParB N-terminal domain-containing protein [Candidatus Micrarchaeota archaeon]
MSDVCSAGDLIAKVLIEDLKGHEKTIRKRLEKMVDDIRRKGQLNPILVDAATFTVLDGHHRVEAMKRLGHRYITARLVDYNHPSIEVHPRRKAIPVDKKKVVEMAENGKRYPPKTTRHVLKYKEA